MNFKLINGVYLITGLLATLGALPGEARTDEQASSLETNSASAAISADALLPVIQTGESASPGIAAAVSAINNQPSEAAVVVGKNAIAETASEAMAETVETPVISPPPDYQFTSEDNFLLVDSASPASGETIYWSPARPDSHAPIGVMGDHTHGQGEIMFSYRYMFMEMDGNRSGTDSLTTDEVLQRFPVTPTRMTMEMHMLGAMYAPSDDFTLMFMAPYISKEMDHSTRSGRRFTTNSEGFGDISLSGLYTVLDQSRQRLHLNLGLSFPTGSIEERDATPMGLDQILPYPMQIGSGTFDLRPGVTYLGQAGDWSWGSQAMGIIRLGTNDNGYRLGDQLMLTAWGAHRWTDWFSTSLRLGGRTWGNIDGQDDRLNPNMIPTANPDLRAGTQLDLGLGLNFYVPEGSLQGARLGVEFNLPLYRSLSGPQLETDFSVTAGLQASF
ncbi:transporter [Sphaerothrix gracilis]|uniref:transporter n=1 Tax=Sphaerothrix gracilis TaxID=3151835 RepID=UPI0031FBC90B